MTVMPLDLLELSEVKETLTFHAGIMLFWTDYRLIWNPREFGNITYIYQPDSKIWVPPFLIENSVSEP